MSRNGIGADLYRIKSPLPRTGEDAASKGNWYHVAVTYDGQEGAEENTQLYWTLMDDSRVQASPVGASQTMGEGLPDFGTNDRRATLPSRHSLRNLTISFRRKLTFKP